MKETIQAPTMPPTYKEEHNDLKLLSDSNPNAILLQSSTTGKTYLLVVGTDFSRTFLQEL